MTLLNIQIEMIVSSQDDDTRNDNCGGVSWNVLIVNYDDDNDDDMIMIKLIITMLTM